MGEQKTQHSETESRALAVVERYGCPAVVDQDSYDQVIHGRAQIREMIDQVDATFEPMRISAYDAYKQVLAQRDKIKKPLEEALKATSKALATWTDEQRRVQKVAESEAARKAQEEAQKAREHELEAARIAGYDDATLQALAQAPVRALQNAIGPAVVAHSTVAKDSWFAQVTDFLALVKFVAKNKNFIHLLLVNQAELNKLARAQKELMSIPGVEVQTKTVISDKRR